jgi:hypothetical protein
MLLEIFSGELELQRQLQHQKSILECRYDFTPLAAFEAVDQLRNNFIDDFAIASFMSKQKYQVNQK